MGWLVDALFWACPYNVFSFTSISHFQFHAGSWVFVLPESREICIARQKKKLLEDSLSFILLRKPEFWGDWGKQFRGEGGRYAGIPKGIGENLMLLQGKKVQQRRKEMALIWLEGCCVSTHSWLPHFPWEMVEGRGTPKKSKPWTRSVLSPSISQNSCKAPGSQTHYVVMESDQQLYIRPTLSQ